MAYEAGSFDSSLAAAAGHDPELLAQLRASFAESLNGQLDLLGRARCDGNWRVAASRLASLAASFHEETLAMLANEALAGAPGDPAVLRQLVAHAAKYTQSS